MSQTLFFKPDSEVNAANLGDAIQQAIEIEIATIPVYLYTYYSINRSPDQDAITSLLVKQLMETGGKTVAEASEVALDISAEIMVYANKAGALIMSVAIEEMLHLALSSNLKQALAGLPDLVGKSPSQWPACLPGHIPPFDINRAKFSQEQLITFLKIESPTDLPKPGLLQAPPLEYTTIGKFYKMIRDYITDPANVLNFNTHSPQLVPGKGYYAQNNIDTVYYDKQHKPQFTNSEDSGDLLCVFDRATACEAIDCIVDQGEGFGEKGLNPDGSVNCEAFASDFDDPNKKELSHFGKFSEIYCKYDQLNARLNNLGIGKMELSDFFVVNIDTNPYTSEYPAHIAPVSTLINGIYTYIFVMIENCYKQSGSTQYEIFMFGIHKSMIFILNSLCGDIMKLTYTKGEETFYAAPTFQDYTFGLVSTPKSQLIDLYNAAVAVYPAISYLGQRIQDLPDVPLQNHGEF